jgi:hypothetical protein
MEGDGVMPYSEVIGAISVVYGGPTVYCQAVVGDFLQFTELCCSCRNLSCCGELLVLLSGFRGNGKEFTLGDGDRDVQGTVDNFAGDGRVSGTGAQRCQRWQYFSRSER